MLIPQELPYQRVLLDSLVVAVTFAITSFFIRTLRIKRAGERLPPGPPGHWLFGHVLPRSHAAYHYSELGKSYGPVYTLRYGSKYVCVITGHRAANDIMVKQSHKLADRPRYIVAGEILSKGMRILATRAGDRLRRLRGSLHAILQPQASIAYVPMQMKHAQNYVLDILEAPEKHLTHAKRRINKGTARLGDALRPGAYLIESYPWLRYVPGMTSKLEMWHQEELNLYRGQVEAVKQRLAKNEVQPCFTTYLLEHQEESGLSDDELAYLAGSMFGAGSDTTSGVLGFFVMAAAKYPDTQRRVQAQLDAVIGQDRLPTFTDQDRLPEVWAYIEELFRWRPVAPAGISHAATEDVFWGDYVIPAGTEVVGCHWAIARDPDVFPDGDTFNPGRWLDDKGQMRTDLRFFNWGFGRRICPGQHLADRSLFITIALTLWAFDMSEDPAHPINTMAIKDGGLAHSEQFAVRFRPRVSELREKIASYQPEAE
ncbi:cytochrome P450 [Ganoderma sinense ZZ0214-1]|uniref:Cytochrome P450 n=1 Tax=Ganoderma sinense ZZ0214-1 TaxID=1077348 RepID=A0A2G8RMB4_9APHY|nr:cytochrome P450 [Ganoderma sinense ZZ0214-1]